MLKQDITYTNFNNETVTETFLFNLTRAETIELEAEAEGGLSEWIKTINVTKNPKAIIATFKKMISLSYGEKTPDGRRFIKSEEISQSFLATEAYSTLFTMLISDAEFAAKFTNGLLHNPKAAQTTVQKDFSEANAPQPASLSITTPEETVNSGGSAFGVIDDRKDNTEDAIRIENARIARRRAEQAMAEADRVLERDTREIGEV